MSSPRRIGLWLVGAFGGVGSTTALGLAALRQKLTDTTGMVTALPHFAGADFDPPEAFVVGGHDIRQTSFTRAAAELHARSNVFTDALLLACKPQLDEWSANVKPGVVFQPNAVIAALADRPDVRRAETAKQAITAIQADLTAFRKANQLDELVVVNVASTEPPFETGGDHSTWTKLSAALERGGSVLPTSGLYAVAAIAAGAPFVNLTPSLGASLPAAEELARTNGVPLLGQDAKTGETLLKSVLAPMFLKRNLRVLSWVGHNILGNRDGLVLNDPANKSSKVKTKEALLGQMLGYQPQSHVSIEYIESLDDWKTAWDHIHFEGFLGTKMTLQFTWQGCDSLLAAPLVIDLARLAALAHRNGDAGTFTPAACFFKSPMGVAEHDLGKQFELLERYCQNNQ